MTINKLKTYLLLTGFFLVSVLVRLPHLDRPLSKHHEFCTAVVLIPLENWAENGAATYHYSPSVSYEGTANRHIENLTAYPVEADGRFYYLSHPPFAYLLPYFCFSILGVYPTALALQIFNLLFHFLSCLLLFQVVKTLVAHTRPQPLKGSSHKGHEWTDSPLGSEASKNFPLGVGGTGSLTAFLIYLFTPAALWFHGNVYMSDMFISNILIIGIWLALKIFLPKEKATSTEITGTFEVPVIFYPIGIFLVIFLMIYTEWMGNFFAFGVFILALVKAFSKKEKHRRKYWLAIASACVLGVIAGLGLIIWQYSSIAGFETYWGYFTHRFGARSGAKFSDNGVFYFLWKYIKMTLRIARHYTTGFLPVLLFGAAVWGVFIYHTKKIFHTPNIATRYFLWLAGFPILMHHFVFVEFTIVHDFATLKGGILLAVLVGLLVEKLLRHQLNNSVPQNPSLRKSSEFKLHAFAESTPQPPPKGEIFCKAENFSRAYLPLWRGLGGGLLLTIFLCIVQYYAINRPGEISQNGDRYDYMQTLGETIRNNAATDEVIFLNGYKPDPQVMYYTKRNMLRASDTTAAKELLKARGAERGVLFTIENYDVKKIEKVNVTRRFLPVPH